MPQTPSASLFDVSDAPALLRTLFDTAIAAAQPDARMAEHLPPRPRGRTVVVGAGKASAAMARALDTAWDGPLEGLVIVPYGHDVDCARIEVVQAAHPVPDDNGVQATRRLRERVQGLSEDDLVIALISGGGSALLVEPAEPLTLADKQAVNQALLASGASITDMNCVRRHLSGIKGGRLAIACHPARVHTLLVSDVPGDIPWDIASGPTLADPTTRADALAICTRYGLALPDAVRAWLADDACESVKPDDPRLAGHASHIIVSPQRSLDSAAALARGSGIEAHLLGDGIEGEARDVASVMAGIARQVALRGQPFTRPCVLISGGETTVTVKGRGRGGRNVEFLLALAIALDGLPGVHALAGDTDGIDGIDVYAGARIDPTTLARAAAMGLNPRDALNDNDAHGFFERLGDSIRTGPTRTNVNDFRAILIG